MSMRGGDGAALCARECSPTEEAYSPSLTDAETVGDEDATDRERDSDEALKREMLQTFEKTRIDDLTKRVAELKGQLIETYQRAQVEKIRADRAEVRLSFAGIGEPLSTQQQMLHIQEERDNATALCDKFKKKLKEVKKEAEQIRGAYDFTLEANVKLTADLEEARNENVGDNETELSHVRTMVAARDAKIEKLVDKNESLTAQYFATSETLKKIKKDSRKDSEGNSFYKAQNENLKSDLEEAQAKLARALLENGRYV
jgi:chromosome segregation ATPase